MQCHAGALPLGGIGAGAVYGTCIGNAVKWFPGRRGLAAGLTAAGFGMGSALTIIPIQHMIESDSYEAAFFYFGLLQGGVIFLCAWMMRAPKPEDWLISGCISLLRSAGTRSA